jgi:hypothetical protein
MRLRKILKFYLSVALFFSLGRCVWAQSESLPGGSRSDTSVFMLNDKSVQVIRHQYGDPHIRFLVLHDTENTGLSAAFQFLGVLGGSIVELKYGNVRNIDFTDSLEQFSFDPNNMFTDEGAYLGLAKYSVSQIRTDMSDKVRKLGAEVLKFGGVDTMGVIVTLHNNYNGGFSIHSYTQGNYLEGSAEDVYINSKMDPDDLVFVTDRRFFNYLMQLGINVVLQANQAPDDGSLSIYAMQNSVPYVNIEVQHGHLAENYRIIVAVNNMLKDFSLQYHSIQD